MPTGRFDEFGSIVGAGVAAVRHSDATEVWHHSTFLGASIGVAVAGDLLWVQGSGEMDESAPSNLFALRPTTGEQRHLIRVPGPASRSPLVAGGRVIAHGGGTYVYGLMAAPVHLPPQVLPTAWATRTYSASLTAPTTGRPPYTWSLPGGSLPAGLTLTPQGALSGTPSVPGLATFTLRVVDSRGMAAQRVTRIAVRASAPTEWRTLGGGPGRSGAALAEGTIDATTVGGFTQRFSSAVVDGNGSPPGDKAEEPLVVGSRVYGLGWDGALRAWSTTAAVNASPLATTVALADNERYVGTPSFAGTPGDGTLYAMTDRGHLVALDATTLTEDWSAVLSTQNDAWEMAPLVVGGVVVVVGVGEVVAVDRNTGLRAWTTPMTSGTRGSASADGTRAFVFDGCDLVALRLTDGVEVWRSDLVPGEQTCSRGLSGPERMVPVVDAGVVFTSANPAGGTVGSTPPPARCSGVPSPSPGRAPRS